MPAKDHRTLGEDLTNVAVRLPASVLEQVDTHIATLRVLSPWARVGRSEALRDLILRGLQSLAPQPPLASTAPGPKAKAAPKKQAVHRTPETDAALARAKQLALELKQQGKGYGTIANILNEQGLPTASGNGKWGGQTVKDVLLKDYDTKGQPLRR